MASESQTPETNFVESLIRTRHRTLTLLLPFILGLDTNSTAPNPDPDPDPDPSEVDRIVLINPFTQGMIVIEGTGGLESMFSELSEKAGTAPASEAAIEAVAEVEAAEGEEGECVICLEEWGVGGKLKEMKCRHRFHSGCVEKWLRIHGSCPVCRYEMPEIKKDGEERRRTGGGGGGGREIWVSFSVRSGTGDSDSGRADNSGTDLD